MDDQNQENDQETSFMDKQEDPELDYNGISTSLPGSRVGTTFIGSELDKSSFGYIRRILTKDKVDDFYDAIERDTGYVPIIRDPNIFGIDRNNRLYAKWDNKGKVFLTKKYDSSEFLKLDTIRGKTDTDFIRRVLGFQDYNKNPKQARSKLNAIKPEQIELEKLPATADQVSEIVEELTLDADVQIEGLNYRELVVLDKSLQTVKEN